MPLRQPALARRHADQLPDDPEPHPTASSDLEERRDSGEFDRLPKKEAGKLEDEI